MTPLIEQLLVKMIEQMPTTVVFGIAIWKLMQFIEMLIMRIVNEDDDTEKPKS